MRSIKFRFIKNSKIVGVKALEKGSIVDTAYDWDDVNEFTGLKDKNGKEIYEGDILKASWGEFWIIWCEKCCGFQIAMESVPCSACEGDIHWWEVTDDMGIEVIGNIYENPELVK